MDRSHLSRWSVDINFKTFHCLILLRPQRYKVTILSRPTTPVKSRKLLMLQSSLIGRPYLVSTRTKTNEIAFLTIIGRNFPIIKIIYFQLILIIKVGL